jgi:hypothetical protein
MQHVETPCIMNAPHGDTMPLKKENEKMRNITAQLSQVIFMNPIM